jgi:hypothetical protein
MELVYYTPNKLYSYQDIRRIDPMQVSFSQMFNPSISLMDRTGSINCPPVSVKILDSFPEWTSPPSFEELCYSRYDSILQQALSSNKTVVIFYSGGIDSTLIAALAIAHPDFHRHRNNLLLAFSEESIKENPKFWYDRLLPAFGHRIINSNGYHTHISDPNNVCITGEFADNIFGSLTVKSYMDVSGDFDAIQKPFADTGRFWLLKKITSPADRDRCGDMMDKIFATSPRPMVSNHDCLWWLNFVLKWQAVKFRLASHAPTPDMVDLMAKNVVHFFETKEFQNWAVMTDEPKVEKDWYSYKLPAKKLIHSINGDDYYLRWKTKYPSIPGLTRYANTHDFIYWDEPNDRYVASKDYLLPLK